MSDDTVMRFEIGGKKYQLDVADLDGREQGTIERLRENYGQGTGTMYGCVLIAKLRAGEKVTEDDVLALKTRTIKNLDDEAGADPNPQVPAGAPGG